MLSQFFFFLVYAYQEKVWPLGGKKKNPKLNMLKSLRCLPLSFALVERSSLAVLYAGIPFPSEIMYVCLIS